MAEKPQAVIFTSAVEGIQKRFGARLSPELVVQIRALGVDMARPQAAYTLTTWDQMVRLMLPALYPGMAEDEAVQRMGYEFVHGFTETALGRAILAVARLMGPRRTLERLNRNFKQIGNYANSKVTDVGPREVLVETWMSEEFLWEWRSRPSLLELYRVGVLRAGVELVGVKPEVDIVKSDKENQRSTYRVRWS